MAELNKIRELVESERLTLSRKLYRDLEEFYSELTTDEAIVDALQANEFTFMKDGRAY